MATARLGMWRHQLSECYLTAGPDFFAGSLWVGGKDAALPDKGPKTGMEEWADHEWELGLKQVYIRQLEVPVSLCKDLFINKDGSQAVQYLLNTDLTLSFQQIITTYQKRWGVEEYYKSLKQNIFVAKAPVKTRNTQANHLFASICAFIKLERLKLSQNMNHFALKT